MGFKKVDTTESGFVRLLFAGNRWSFDRFVSYQDMLDRIRERFTLERLQDGPNDTSKVN